MALSHNLDWPQTQTSFSSLHHRLAYITVSLTMDDNLNLQHLVTDDEDEESSVGDDASASGDESSSSTPQDATRQLQEQVKKAKERFLLFTRVLVKYLEHKDPPLHARVKEIVTDCSERHERGEYKSLTSVLHKRLKEVVSDAYWKRAEVYMKRFLKEREEMAAAAKAGRTTESLDKAR